MSVRPVIIDEIIGQSQAKVVCKTLTYSAKARNTSIPHIMFSGPPGTGKTTFARAMANEISSKIIQANAISIKTEKDMKNLLQGVEENSLFFIDEIHALSNKMCEFLYTVMEDNTYFVAGYGTVLEVEIPPFTLIGATTRLGQIPKPMRDRFKYVAEFVEYSHKELIDIVLLVAKTYNLNLSLRIASAIASTCRGIPRIVVSRTEWIRDYMISNNIKSLTTKQVLDVISLQGVDKDGLENIDHRYLQVLKEEGVASINLLSAKLSLDKDTILSTIEPYLLKIGKIEITTKGRTLK